MKKLSLFWKIYLTLLLVLSLPMILFSLADVLSNNEKIEKNGPPGLIKNLNWNARAIANQAEQLPDDTLLPWIQDIEQSSGLELYLEINGKNFPSARPGWVDSLEAKAHPPYPFRPIVVSASSATGKSNAFLMLDILGKPGGVTFRNPFFRDAAMLFIALLGGWMSYLLVRSFMKPLVELRKTTRCLAEGDFSVRVGESVTHRGDEIAALGVSFNWMAERVEDLVAAHKRLMSDISHEIRSPLQRMDVAVTLARENYGSDVEIYLNRVELEVGRIDAMVEELLTLTRAESQASLESEPVEIDALVRSVVDDAAFEGQLEGKHIVSDLKTLTVRGDEALLKRALGNVVHNAIRYTRQKTDVKIEIKEEDGYAVIFVTDQGNGVPEEELEKIFLPYYRTDKARERSRGGTELGLTITRRIIESHKGDIGAHNVPTTGGLVVKIRLPLDSAG